MYGTENPYSYLAFHCGMINNLSKTLCLKVSMEKVCFIQLKIGRCMMLRVIYCVFYLNPNNPAVLQITFGWAYGKDVLRPGAGSPGIQN